MGKGLRHFPKAGLCFPCAFNCYEAIKPGQECCFQKKDENQETVWRQEIVFIMEPWADRLVQI